MGELISRSQYEEALQLCLDYHDKYKTSGSLIFLLSDWIELGRRYPQANKALLELRDHDVREFAEGRGFSELFSEVVSINQYLQDENSTYALFNSFRDKDPDLARQCYGFVEGLLAAKGDYQYCYEHMGSPQGRFDQIHGNYEMHLDNQKRMENIQQMTHEKIAEANRQHGWTNAVPPPNSTGFMKNTAVELFVGQTRLLIEILVATGHNDDAKKIRDEALAILNDARLQSAVTDAEVKIKK